MTWRAASSTISTLSTSSRRKPRGARVITLDNGHGHIHSPLFPHEVELTGKRDVQERKPRRKVTEKPPGDDSNGHDREGNDDKEHREASQKMQNLQLDKVVINH